MLTISTVEPISLALFLGVPKTDVDRNQDKENSSSLTHITQHTAAPSSSAIVTMIEMLLSKVVNDHAI